MEWYWLPTESVVSVVPCLSLGHAFSSVTPQFLHLKRGIFRFSPTLCDMVGRSFPSVESGSIVSGADGGPIRPGNVGVLLS